MECMTCIICPNSCSLTVSFEEGRYVIEGNLCNRGREFAINEVTNPKRSVCSTIKTIYNKIPRLPVRTDGEVSLKYVFDIIAHINSVLLDYPVHTGDVIIRDVCGTGINIIATSDAYELLEKD